MMPAKNHPEKNNPARDLPEEEPVRDKIVPVYPAVMHWDEDHGGYEAILPDFGMQTCGGSLADAFLMACDFLRCILDFDYTPNGIPMPAPTPFGSVPREEGDIVLLVHPMLYAMDEKALGD